MNEFTTTKDVLDFPGGTPKPSSGLNIVTILTIVGSILGLISAVWSFISAKKTYETMKTSMESGKSDDATGWAKDMMTPEMLEMSRKAMENRMPLLIVGLLGSALCLYGALEMRKLKKQGYLLWLIGEIIPLIGTMLFLGAASLSGFGLIGVVFPIIFIILYTVYRKELIY